METIFLFLLQTISNPFKHQIQIMCPPISFNVKFVIETWQKHAWTTSISYLLRLNCSLFRHEYSDVRLIINKSWTHVNTSETQSLGKRTQQEGNNSDRHKITDSIHITVVNQHLQCSTDWKSITCYSLECWINTVRQTSTELSALLSLESFLSVTPCRVS